MTTNVVQCIGHLRNTTIPIYYSTPSLIITNTGFDVFKTALDQIRAGGPWIWVVNCSGLCTEHILKARTIQRLADLLRAEHTGLLQATWIIGMASWMRAVLTTFGAEANTLSADRLELFVQLQRAGFPQSAVDFLLAKCA